MFRVLTFESTLKWEKDSSFRRNYSRDFTVQMNGKTPIKGSADYHFFGNKDLHNPEEYLLIALSACHMLSFLHICFTQKIEVLDYVDNAKGYLNFNQDGSGEFSKVELFPNVVISGLQTLEQINQLHKEANRLCFIARSCNFPVLHFPKTKLN